MILIGRFLSPFVRRVGVTLNHYGLAYEHRQLSTRDAKDEIRKINPLGRVPALVLDDGDVLVDSSVIVDYLDHVAGPAKSLTPLAEPERHRVLSLSGVATGTADKVVSWFYESQRPKERIHEPYFAEYRRQALDGFRWLDGKAAGPWMTGERMTQADVMVACAWSFMRRQAPELHAELDCPKLAGLVARMAELPAFTATEPA